MTPEQFYSRVREILKKSHPDATLDFLVEKSPGTGVYPAAEKDGRLQLNTGEMVAAQQAHVWHLTVFAVPADKFNAELCGSVAMHPRAVTANGSEFADRVGKQLARMVTSRRDNSSFR